MSTIKKNLFIDDEEKSFSGDETLRDIVVRRKISYEKSMELENFHIGVDIGGTLIKICILCSYELSDRLEFPHYKT